jgi:hypothetical protein
MGSIHSLGIWVTAILYSDIPPLLGMDLIAAENQESNSPRSRPQTLQSLRHYTLVNICLKIKFVTVV